ncbi:hypothetical protein ACFC1R_32875 [Kitasatospora sp. NPDC056138]|uniref:hypothetical protein n=1 Tax=Kitasatospora sp. NPDC056138 TaxID=3345724 RepID=UPI0035D9B922
MTIILTVLPAALLAWLIGRRLGRARLMDWARDRFDPAEYGLVPRDRLDARRAGPAIPLQQYQQMQAIADAAWEGDWRPAAAYLEAAGQDWDERWTRLELLQEIARSEDAWLVDWRAARPADCDAATLHARHLLHRAWEARGTGEAHEVPAERTARFGELLPAAMAAAREASELAPADPGPWVVMITAARGLRYSPEQFRALWEGLVERAPHHYAGHRQALQYWSAEWSGSDRLMLEFAERAVRSAPAGSPLAGMYLHALYELTTRSPRSAVPSSGKAGKLLADVARSLDQVPAGDERLPQLRHLLAHLLGRAGRYDAALEQFRLLGPWCGAEPWIQEKDPVAAFDLARGIAAKKAGRAQPRTSP